MGTIKKGIMGGFSGKVGNVVGASWNGVSYIRSMPSKVRNPKTIKQQAQRARFAMVLNFIQEFADLAEVGFRNTPGKRKPLNEAMAYNIQYAVKGVFPNLEIDYPKVAISRGRLYVPLEVSVVCQNGVLNFSWGTRVKGKSADSDIVMLMAYNPVVGEAEYEQDAAQRQDGAASLALPQAWDGDPVETYLAFVSLETKQVSRTVYTGRVQVQFS